MFMIGVLIDISLIFGQSDSKIDGVSVVSNWNKLSSSQREKSKKIQFLNYLKHLIFFILFSYQKQLKVFN